jgi:hypothetical protein
MKKIWVLSQQYGGDLGAKSFSLSTPKNAPFDRSMGCSGTTMDPNILKSFVFECEPDGPEKDFPWCGLPATIGNDRVKAVIEEHLPGIAQILPIEVRHEGKPWPTRYWLFNWLRVYDCLDLEASEYEVTEDYAFALHYILDKSRIPDEATIFRVKYSMSRVAITDEASYILQDAGLTGMCFDPPHVE